jgi:hypothetical protein
MNIQLFQAGDLVKDYWSNEIGIIVEQIGVADRWLVYWFEDKYFNAYNACNLELL